MNNEPLSYVSEEDFEFLYQTIKAKLLIGKEPSENPFMVVLGGQPGAGKGNVYRLYHDTVTDNFVTVNCDDFREFHPHFEELFQKYGDADSDYTQKFVGDVSKRLVRELSAEGYNMIFESTLNNPNVALSIQDQLKPLGYQVDLCVISTNREVSLQSTINRKEEMIREGKQPRGVTPEYHDYVCERICDALSALYESGKMDNIRIFTRNAECLYDYSVTPGLDPTPILEARLNHPEEEAKQLIAEYIRTEKLTAVLEQLDDPQKFNQFLRLQGCMCDKSVDAALEFFDKGRTFKLTDFDWRLSEVKPEEIKAELELPKGKKGEEIGVATGLALKFIDRQSVRELEKDFGVPEERERVIFFAAKYSDLVRCMIVGRMESGSKENSDPVPEAAHSFFKSLDTKQKLCLLEHCRADAAKALEATGRTIDTLKSRGPII
ncbi:MAG: zeta toxin family protein [Oscillospiraceae bacterium]|nr:zeta toxin family protein [Oscillospiraceae bacterium]MBR3536864.1 zeta toxin family protein [Oscillospiraceae bacterium]MBR4344538.1 zeta toxin family protein [Lachnospiraceae bacterium]MBR6837293.1 zeta toxin family protein [Oscillospiraceae bacterium]MBR6923699.1 zeta toxin family protein [Oscillospiraceae bacterium]